MMFSSTPQNQRPSLQVLDALYQYDDFMQSIDYLVDLGCGAGEDLLWWGTATTRDDVPVPLNIKCVGIDQHENLPCVKPYANVNYRCADFEQPIKFPEQGFDVLWCFDSFQYAINPLNTLKNWWSMASAGAMLCVSVPQTTNFSNKRSLIHQKNSQYYHYTLVNLIHMLAISGWDCKSGFFLKKFDSEWIHAVVYKHDDGGFDPRTTTWYELAECNRLPESAEKIVMAHGYLKQEDLILPWLDKSFSSMSRH